MKLEKIKIGIDDLLLDPNNPRFADISDDALNIDQSRFGDALIQEAAFEKMMNPKFDVITLANSISTVGFVPVDNIVVSKVSEKLFYVIEGNRRTSAIKYLIKQFNLGLSTLSEVEIKNLKNIEVLAVDNMENSNLKIGMIIQGIRNVSGIKEWEAFQKAQFINQMIDFGKQPGEISKTIGIPVKEINRYYKTYSVMLQFKTDEEYASKWKPSYFSYFDEILKKPALRNFFEFNEETFRFDNIENIKRFYEWIVPDEEGKSTFSDARTVRRLSELLDDNIALNYLDDRNFDKAVNYINQKNFNQNIVSVNECIVQIRSAINAFKTILAESLEIELTDEEFTEIKLGIDEMNKNFKRVEQLYNVR
ncbi:ParB N-terminal domain-containing protein [Leptospira sp. GIMC2001]|uniref:ParB N-terminal domain-containing protein n=1 Tax=Leptospira sp. GIMC2001 TaxID=1513297 RepID=UPI00234949D3|nr:ParB N-terminal domain-containing protein [Leptospira sp. GIMC2001]WCL50784.1 ParB N-terminal domain-containing protein [Leptospira sp. GIMC2001]